MSGTTYNAHRLAGLFCDAFISVEGGAEFPVHRIVLYECSLYFQALFKRWTRPGQVFHIPIVSPDTMQLIIEFAYTGSVALTEDNVQDMMVIADMLNITGIIRACSNFFCEHLHPQNCIGIWSFTNICLSPELRCAAFRYITDHFEEVVPCKEFLQLSVKDLTEIIGKDELNVRFESYVFDAIMRWIGHLPRARAKHIAVLLAQVRLGLTSRHYILNNVLHNKMVKSNTECRQIAEHSMRLIWQMSKRTILKNGLRNTLARPRVPCAVMLVTGGWRGHNPTGNIEAYDPCANLWINISEELSYPRAYHGTVFLNGYVYFFGGFDSVQYFSNMVRLDLATHTWQEVAPMHSRRCYVSVTVLNGFIYALGGHDGHIRLNTAERYCPETNQWTLLASMQMQRSDASCTALEGKIYICGGFNGAECLQTAECYDPETNRWTNTNPMSTMRSGLKVATLNNLIYAVGGYDGQSRLASVETYNPRHDTWRQRCPMLTCRSNFCLDVMRDQIYVTGGFDGFSNTSKGEVYNPHTDMWSHISVLEVPRSAACACVLTGIPNIADFISSRDSLPYLNMDNEEDSD